MGKGKPDKSGPNSYTVSDHKANHGLLEIASLDSYHRERRLSVERSRVGVVREDFPALSSIPRVPSGLKENRITPVTMTPKVLSHLHPEHRYPRLSPLYGFSF